MNKIIDKLENITLESKKQIISFVFLSCLVINVIGLTFLSISLGLNIYIYTVDECITMCIIGIVLSILLLKCLNNYQEYKWYESIKR